MRHGTTTGARQHYKDGTPVCDACRKAISEYDKKPERKARKNMMIRAGRRAKNRLAKANPTMYRALYLEELDKLEGMN